MITKDKIKKEIDKLPDGLLEQVYDMLKKFVSSSKKQNPKFTIRDFKGKLDGVDVRRNAYE